MASSRERKISPVLILALLTVPGSLVAARFFLLKPDPQVTGGARSPQETQQINTTGQQIAAMSEAERERFFKSNVCAEGRKLNASGSSYLVAVEQKTRDFVEKRGEKFNSPKWQKSVTGFRSMIAKLCPEVW